MENTKPPADAGGFLWKSEFINTLDFFALPPNLRVRKQSPHAKEDIKT